MSGARYTLVGLIVAALAAPAVSQEGGFMPPLNADPVIPIPTGQAGQPGFCTSAEFVIEIRSSAIGRTPPRTTPDLSHLTAGGFGPYCARALPRPASLYPVQQLYLQLLAIGEPFRSGAEELSAQDTLLRSFAKR
jgi:hypothetical protein